MLPKIDVPIYEVKLISNGNSLRFRPFTVKEEKLFLMANESDDLNTILDTIKQVINNCVLDDIDINELPMFDIEYVFLNIRARSIGETIDLKYKCNNKLPKVEGEEEEKTCNNMVEIQLNILDIEPEKTDTHSNRIEITENMGMVMKYPSFKSLKEFDIENEADSIVNITVGCIDYIYDKEQIYYAKDNTREELVEFLESMQSKDLEKVRLFFDTIPKMKKTIHFKCNKCEHEEDIELEGIQSFFA